MSLQRRFELLRFIVQDLELGLLLAKETGDDFVQRTLARHVLIRAENLIEHTRRLRKPLNASGASTGRFHQAKETYAKLFVEYFELGRHKLAGHVQDLDFGARIDLWNSVDLSKISFFTESACEIYNVLGTLGLADLQPLESFPELSSLAVLSELREFADENTPDGFLRIGIDPLSTTRQGTGTILNFTPLHQRAGQLALIRLWLSHQIRLHDRLRRFPNAERLLRARIVTDVVSFADCLITRPDKAPETVGLNELLAQSPHRSAQEAGRIVGEFLRRYDYRRVLEPVRRARNTLGGHVADNGAACLRDVISEFDSCKFREAVDLFHDLWRVFEQACQNSGFLQSYLLNDVPLYGIRPGPGCGAQVVPFNSVTLNVQLDRGSDVHYDDVVALHFYLDRWVQSENDDGEERHFWLSAMSRSPVSETVSPEGERSFELRLAHEVLLCRLRNVDSNREASRLLQLIESGVGVCPRQLTEVLVRYQLAPGPTAISDAAILRCMGRVADWRDLCAQICVRRGVESHSFELRTQALVTAFNMFINDECCNRLNSKTVGLSYSASVEPLLEGMPPVIAAVALAAFAGTIYWGRFAHSRGIFDEDLKIIHAAMLDALAAIGADCAIFSAAIRANDYVAVCLIAYGHLKARADELNAFHVLRAPGRLVPCASSFPEGRLNLALAQAMRGDTRQAVRLALSVAERYPERVELLTTCAWIILEADSSAPEATDLINRLRTRYVLDEAQRARLQQLEELSRR
jgi:hypothetical protein